MGEGYSFKCSSCGYGIEVIEGIGMMYSPHAVFYGRGENGEPLLSSLVKSEIIKKKAFDLLAAGAQPDDNYGHELYMCPKCMRFSNRFYFKLRSATEDYEPDYKCSSCKTSLKRVMRGYDGNGCLMIEYRNHRKADWKCPKCNGKELEEDQDYIITLWD